MGERAICSAMVGTVDATLPPTGRETEHPPKTAWLRTAVAAPIDVDTTPLAIENCRKM